MTVGAPLSAPADAVEQVLRSDGASWALAGPLTINNVGLVLAASVDLPLPSAGRVDLKDVDPVDSAGVALLLEWKRRATLEHKMLKFENMTPSMASLAALYGVDGLLSSP